MSHKNYNGPGGSRKPSNFNSNNNVDKNSGLSFNDADYDAIVNHITRIYDADEKEKRVKVLYYLSHHTDCEKPQISGVWRMLKSLYKSPEVKHLK